MADTFLYAQLQPFTLAGAGASIGDATITLSSFETIDGVALAMTDFGTIGFGTLEPNNGTSEEQISFSGVTQNANGTATLTGVKTVLFIAPYTQTANLAKSHTGGSKFVVSNTSAFYDKISGKDNDETITGLWTFTSTKKPIFDSNPTFTDDKELITKKYADDLAIAGSPDMNLTVKGLGEEATAAEINAGTQAGGTLAELVVNPKFLKDSEYYTLRPTTDEKGALAGSGTPSAANKYVTADTDALKELLTNKDTTTTLGTSDTKYPSQNAVKTYVDTATGAGSVAGSPVSDTDDSTKNVDTVYTLGYTAKTITIYYVLTGKDGSGTGAYQSGIATFDGTTLKANMELNPDGTTYGFAPTVTTNPVSCGAGGTNSSVTITILSITSTQFTVRMAFVRGSTWTGASGKYSVTATK